MNTPRIVAATVIAAAVTATVALSPPRATAGPAHPAVARLIFHCTLTVTDRGPHISVRLQVTSNRPHRHWQMRFSDDGHAFALPRTTSGPHGGFEVVRRTVDRAGTDHILARATEDITGATCRIPIDVHP